MQPGSPGSHWDGVSWAALIPEEEESRETSAVWEKYFTHQTHPDPAALPEPSHGII